VKEKLSVRLMVPTVAVVGGTLLLFGWVMTRTLESQVRSGASRELDEQLERMAEGLQEIDQLSSQSVAAAMKVLMREGAQVGMPRLSGTAAVGGQEVPALWLGKVPQAGDFALVDRVKQLMGSTATLFVRRGEAFIRVSTNVQKPDGSRAIGTQLDPNGRAIAAIRDGRAFYGVVDILGTPYMTGYEPMRDASGQVVGIWYVGYPLVAVADLGRHIGESRVLSSGFVALLDHAGKVVFRSAHASDDEVKDRVAGAAGWTARTRPVASWGYTLAAAFPEADVGQRLQQMKALLAECLVLMLALLVAAQYLVLRKLVLGPVRRLVTRMQNADLKTTLVESRHEMGGEIGVLATSFDGFVCKIRKALLQVMQTSAQVAEASKQLSSASGQIAAHSEGTSSQSRAVAQETSQISDRLNGVAAGTEQMSGTVKSISSNAADAARVAGEAVSASQAATGTIARLSDASAQVGKTVRLISAIAQQTNLLALNATIEAARAGAAGAGFSVVASEVKELARQTAKATEEIGGNIAAIQTESKAAVDAIGAVGGVIEQIRGISHTIATAVEQQSATTREMSRNVTEAAGGSTRISQSIDGVARDAEGTSASARELLRSAEQLAGTAAALDTLIGQFRIDAAQGR